MKVLRLKEISKKIGSGSTPTGGSESYGKSGISLIRSLNVYDFNFDYEGLAFINEEQAYQLRGVTVEEDDILLNITGASVARCCMVPREILPARVNQHVSIIRVDKIKANPRYILYYLNSPSYKKYLLALASTGATREALTKETIENLKIQLPPRDIQDGIVHILSAFDELIEKNKQRIKLLKEMAEGIYNEWFVRFRFPGYESATFLNKIGKEVPRGTSGALPEGWETIPFEKEIFFQEGPGLRKWQWTNAGMKVINVTNILGDGNVDVNNTNRFISQEEFKKTYRHFEVVANDIVVASSGNTYGKMGKVLAMHLPIMMNTSVIRFNSKDPNRLRSSYLQAFLFSREMKNQIEKFVIGSAQPNFGPSHLKKMKLVYPNQGTMDHFDKIVSPIFAQIDCLRTQTPVLQKNRDLLLPRLISGKLSVDHFVKQEWESLSLAAEPEPIYSI